MRSIKNMKFKLLRRQQPKIYINITIKANDILQFIKNKWDRHRVLACIQILMKKGKSEKALKIVRQVISNLFKEESERRSKLGGIYYIIDGIKRLEHVLQLMPIKKKGRVRYKKIRHLNQQKSISRAVQLLVKFIQQKVKSTQQSYETVLTKEFKDLYTGLSHLYRKNDEIYQEIIMTRYRRRYFIRPAIYLAKYRKQKEHNSRDKQRQKIKKRKKSRKRRKNYKNKKKRRYKRRLKKIRKFFIKKKKKIISSLYLYNYRHYNYTRQTTYNISRKNIWFFFTNFFFSDRRHKYIVILYIYNKIKLNKKLLLIFVKELFLFTNKNNFLFNCVSYLNNYLFNKKVQKLWLVNNHYLREVALTEKKKKPELLNFYNLILFKIKNELFNKIFKTFLRRKKKKKKKTYSKRRINIITDFRDEEKIAYPHKKRYSDRVIEKLLKCEKIEKVFYSKVKHDNLLLNGGIIVKKHKLIVQKLKKCL